MKNSLYQFFYFLFVVCFFCQVVMADTLDAISNNTLKYKVGSTLVDKTTVNISQKEYLTVKASKPSKTFSIVSFSSDSQEKNLIEVLQEMVLGDDASFDFDITVSTTVKFVFLFLTLLPIIFYYIYLYSHPIVRNLSTETSQLLTDVTHPRSSFPNSVWECLWRREAKRFAEMEKNSGTLHIPLCLASQHAFPNRVWERECVTSVIKNTFRTTGSNQTFTKPNILS